GLEKLGPDIERLIVANIPSANLSFAITEEESCAPVVDRINILLVPKNLVLPKHSAKCLKGPSHAVGLSSHEWNFSPGRWHGFFATNVKDEPRPQRARRVRHYDLGSSVSLREWIQKHAA